eukprot:jgi/Orpsp1_1/1177162/evm.model.c7180000060432.1
MNEIITNFNERLNILETNNQTNSLKNTSSSNFQNNQINSRFEISNFHLSPSNFDD